MSKQIKNKKVVADATFYYMFLIPYLAGLCILISPIDTDTPQSEH